MTSTSPKNLGKAGVDTLAYWSRLAVLCSAVIAGLVFGASFLIPIAVALMLFVLLTAIIDWIASQKIGDRNVPRWMAHFLGVSMLLAGLGGVMLVFGNQASDVSAALPKYEAKLAQIIVRVVAAIGEENAQLVQENLVALDFSSVATATVNSASAFLSSLFLVLLYVPFLMVERKPMAKKLPLAAGDPVVGQKISFILQDISVGVKKYIGIKTLVSLVTGLFSYAVMKPMALDFAETWAVLAFALNFIPSIGSILAVIFPALVALVQFDTLGPFLIVALGCGAVQFTIGNVVEPAIAGKSLNLSPFMVILALTFWSSIWGMSGAFLSVPITVCILIVFSHLPATRPIAILMSGDGLLRSGSELESSSAENPTSVGGQPAAVLSGEED